MVQAPIFFIEVDDVKKIFGNLAKDWEKIKMRLIQR